MKTLTIKDLSRTEALDAKAMSAVSGGMMKLPFSPLFSSSTDIFKFDASQQVGQSQNTEVNNGNNVAFASGITSTVTPHQTANNNINFL